MHGINLLKYALTKDPERVLDLGVGGGTHAKALIGIGASVTGVDVRDAPHEHERYTHIQSPIETLEREDDAELFDMVWCCHTLEHMPNVQFALRQMFDFLKDDGWLFLGVPSCPQDRLHIGHLTLWTPALLVYNLICAGWDCSDAQWYTCNQTIGLCVQKKAIEDMSWRTGLPNEVNDVNKYSPIRMLHEYGTWWDNNWPVETRGRVIDPPMVTAGVQESNLPPKVQLAFGPNPKLRVGYEQGKLAKSS